MAVTQNNYTGNGSTVLFSFTFPYLKESDIKVTVNGSLTTAYSLANATTIQFTTAPANGAAILIYRETDDDQLKAEFFPGSAIRAQDLNKNFTQTLYVVQEVVARAISKIGDTMQGILNMGGFKITNLGAPATDTDAANKQYIDERLGEIGIPGHTRWTKTATAGQTVLTGTGDEGNTLEYSASREQVFVNGALLQRNIDYTANDGLTITLLVPLILGDLVDVRCVNNLPTGISGLASDITFLQAGTGATSRSVQNKLRDVVSVKDFGAVGDGVADDTAAIQAAVNSGARTVYFPNGSYKVNSTIRQASNGYAMRFVGENKHHAALVAGPSLTAGAPIVWFGNSNGHGNYRAQVSYLTFIGNNNCEGLRYHEAGTSEIVSCQFVDCTIGISCPGIIGTQIQRCDIYNCTVGINMTRPTMGTPSGPDDITTTASPLSLSNNINKVSDCWISGGSCGIHVEGGLTHIQGCTFQAVGNNAARSVIELVTANESVEYGGGPIVSNCWSESGTYLAFVYLENTRKAIIRENFISLDGLAQVGLYADSSSVGTTVQNNSFLGRGTAALTGSRTQNAAIYIDSVQTTLMNNHYASFGTYTYAQLIKLNWATTSGNVVIEQGQNTNNGYGIYLGLTQVGTGNIGLIGPNPLVGDAFNNYLNNHQLSGCRHDSIVFNTGAGPVFFVKAGAPVPGDATFIGDLCLDRTNANLYIHVGSGAWKLITRAP